MSPSETGSYNAPDARSQQVRQMVACESIRFFRLKFLVFSAGETKKLEPKKTDALAG